MIETKWIQSNRYAPVVLSLGFGLLFYLGYYLWWPLIFLAPAPLALTAENRHVRTTGFATSIISAATFVAVYRFFTVYSLEGLVAVCAYHGLTVTCVVVASRALRRITRLPLAFVFPPLWTGGEVWRLSGEIGLPFGLLAPPANQQLWMIQVCDIGGLPILSLAIAMTAGVVADWIRVRKWNRTSPRHSPDIRNASIARYTTAGVWILIACYGHFRLLQAKHTMSQGPKVSVVQPDIPTRPHTRFGFDKNLMLRDLIKFGDQAMQSTTKPDLIVWPEAMSGISPFHAASSSDQTNESSRNNDKNTREPGERPPIDSFYQTIQAWVQRNNRPLIIGAIHQSQRTSEKPSTSLLKNIALLIQPGERATIAQEKIRLFPIGEYLPLKETSFWPWIIAISPKFERLYGRRDIAPGSDRAIHTLRTATEAPYRYVVSICNEIMYPKDAGCFLNSKANRKAFDFVINMSNNGGFQRNQALIFHSLLLPFRAVEARVGIARSSNTGISGFVKPTGEIYGEVLNQTGQRWTGLGAPELDLIARIIQLRTQRENELTTNLPLRKHVEKLMHEVQDRRSLAGVSGQSTQTIWIDHRQTLYSQSEDVFGITLCLFLWFTCAFLVPMSMFPHRHPKECLLGSEPLRLR